MFITCPACSTRYDLPEGAIGSEGRTVRCAQCRTSWFEPGADVMAEASAMVPEGEAQGSATSRPDEPDAVAQGSATTQAAAAAANPPISTVDEQAAVSAGEQSYYPDGDASSFGYEPPFQPRRRGAGGWLLALLLFVLVALGIGGAIAWYGAPDWLPIPRATFAKAKPGLVLDFPPSRLERRTLADGTEFFGARGTITNTSQSRRSLPPILIVLRDRQQREVYRWEVVPPKRQLGPGESITINEAVTDIPKNATVPEIGWKAG